MSTKKRLPFGGELAVAGLLVAVLSLIILPLPPLVIDALLSVNIGLSILLLMVALYAPSTTSLSTFPSMLLFTTLLRLALNIASTKAILLHAEAGHIIDAFGHLVVGGNLVVGLVVFIIIAVVQFIVIAKGSERSSEVSARFALDGMPGQQMSIDAELRGGSITAEEAKRLRAQLAMESQLFGGMDGAMKFVKGDAIAGLVITFINLIAGIVVGVSYHGMSMGESAQRFSVLAVGDGMVSQIPSLLISVAAGVLTTRVADKGRAQQVPLGQEIVRQLSGNARALYMSAALMLGFGLVPGFPLVLFVFLASVLIVTGYNLNKRPNMAPLVGSDAHRAELMPSLRGFGAKGDGASLLLQAPPFSSPIDLRLSQHLRLKITAQSLDQAIGQERMRLEEEMGLPFPGMAVWVSQDLSRCECEVRLQDVPTGHLLFPEGFVAVKTTVPQPDWKAVPGLAAVYWAAAEALPFEGAQMLSTEELIAQCVIGLLTKDAHLFIGIQETQWIFDKFNADYQGLVSEVQKVLPMQRVADVLRRLLEEQVPIRNMRNILESLVYWGPKEKDVLMLTEYVRGDLGRLIAYQATNGGPRLNALFLDVDIEQQIRQAIKPTPTGNFLALAQEEVTALMALIQTQSGKDPLTNTALVTSMDIRRYVRRMIQHQLPWLPVYSFQELGSYLELVPVGQVSSQ